MYDNLQFEPFKINGTYGNFNFFKIKILEIN